MTTANLIHAIRIARLIDPDRDLESQAVETDFDYHADTDDLAVAVDLLGLA